MISYTAHKWLRRRGFHPLHSRDGVAPRHPV